MDSRLPAPCVHDRAFLGAHHGENERRAWSVVALTAAMMIAEIAGGSLFGSMALIADGWHMATHAAALTIAALAYLFARRYTQDPRFSLGTGKFGELAAFASAIILGIIALGVGYESVLRLLHPVVIRFHEAVPIAAIGLCVNLASAWLLRRTHDHVHHHPHDDAHPHNPSATVRGFALRSDARDHRGADDTNFRAAYVHVLTDALTSVLVIGALAAAWAFGWTFMDPAVGLIGMIVIVSWSLSLVRSAGGVLLDTVPDPTLEESIRSRIETGGDRLTDLHLWRLGPGHAALIAAIVSPDPQPPAVYKERLEGLAGLSHITIEVNACGA